MSDFPAVIAAFTDDQVSRLTGLTVAQLRYWDRTGFFVPSYADNNRRLSFSRIYSFKDVASLRAIGTLRMQFNVPLQELRRVGQALSHLGDDLWTKTVLYVLNRKVIFKEPGTDLPREIVSGQFVIGVALLEILTDTKEAVARLNRRSDEQIGKVERSRYVNHNAFVIAGTRIPTAAIKRFHDAGYAAQQIIDEYPDLTRRDIEAALAHETRHAA